MKVVRVLTTVLLLRSLRRDTSATEGLNLSDLIAHMPEVDQAFGNLVPLQEVDDENIITLISHRVKSASLRYSAFLDSYAYLMMLQQCVAGSDLISLS